MEYPNKDNGDKPDAKGSERDDTFFLPKGITGEPGDILTFRVVGATPEGETEVEQIKEDSGPSFGDDLHKEMANPSTQEPM